MRTGTSGLGLALSFLTPVAVQAQSAPADPILTQRALPPMHSEGRVPAEGAQIWYGSVGEGPPVILLHGGMASSRSWGGQVAPLVMAGYRVILIDSRGHGRSTLGDRPLSYELMARDVRAVIDRLGLRRPAIIGWSDGAIIALVLAMRGDVALRGVYAFGANMDAGGVRADAAQAPILKRVGPILAADHAALSPDPDGFAALQRAVRLMQATQPNYSAAQLRTIRAPMITIAGAREDEFILPAHQEYLARTIPGARLEMFGGTGHFAPWARTAIFNQALVHFLERAAERPD